MNRKEALEILGLSPSDNPSEYEIRKAYRKLALEYHPDKHSHESKDVQKQNEEKFKELGAAYNLLTDKGTEEVTKLTDKNLDEINSPGDLKLYLYMALLEKDIAFLKKLFSKFKSSKDGKFGDYINETLFGGDLPLFSAIFFGNVELVKLLLENGANPNIRNKYGDVPLYKASILGHDSVVELLLENGANPNIQDKHSNFLLYQAFSWKHDSIVKLLLEHGADPNIQNEHGEFLLYEACSKGRDNIVKLLLEHGADA